MCACAVLKTVEARCSRSSLTQFVCLLLSNEQSFPLANLGRNAPISAKQHDKQHKTYDANMQYRSQNSSAYQHINATQQYIVTPSTTQWSCSGTCPGTLPLRCKLCSDTHTRTKECFAVKLTCASKDFNENVHRTLCESFRLKQKSQFEAKWDKNSKRLCTGYSWTQTGTAFFLDRSYEPEKKCSVWHQFHWSRPTSQAAHQWKKCVGICLKLINVCD